MKNKFLIVYTILCLTALQTTYAQSSLKRGKQKTDFHYVQGVLHYGYSQTTNGTGRMDIPSSGPSWQASYQFLSKNQRLLQRGYVKNVAMSNFKFRISNSFSGSLTKKSEKAKMYRTKLQNLGFSFKTKWDRTSFFVGYGSVKFGHNPKIDPVVSFTANSTKKDLGFGQDLGLSFRTALSQKYDLELGLYSGGAFNQPLLYHRRSKVMEKGQQHTKGKWKGMEIDYQGNWLATARIGRPVFNRFEYGLIAMSGKIKKGEKNRTITRIGADMVGKISEKLKVENQVTIGPSSFDGSSATKTLDLSLQSNVEYYLKGRYVLATSNAVLFHKARKENTSPNTHNGQWVNSLGYIFSPHTRLRMIHYLNYSNIQQNDWGLTLQLVTGIGRR